MQLSRSFSQTEVTYLGAWRGAHVDRALHRTWEALGPGDRVGLGGGTGTANAPSSAGRVWPAGPECLPPVGGFLNDSRQQVITEPSSLRIITKMLTIHFLTISKLLD